MMLREIKSVRQIPGEPVRRWFNAEDMDLIVWYQASEIIGFQLCYDKSTNEKAISWKQGLGLKHEDVNNNDVRDGPYKGSPVLTLNNAYDIEKIKRSFEEYSQYMDDNVSQFVLQKL